MKNSSLYMVMMMFLMLSCTKNHDDFGPQTEGEEIPVAKTERIVVVNEGNFMFGNGSISVVDNTNDEVAQEVFKNKNGYPMGDVPQSITIYDSLGFIVVNNSGKIEVVNQEDFSSLATITGFTSPRYLEVVSVNPLTAWVTDLYSNKIWIVNLQTYQITGSIISDGWSENMIAWNDNVLVMNKKDSVIHVFELRTEQKTNTIGSGMKIVDFDKWSDNELLVLAQSGTYILDLNTMDLSLKTAFNPSRKPSKLAVDTNLNFVYFLEKEVFRENQSIEKVISAFSGSNFYGLEVSSSTGEVFLTNAKDYLQPGSVIKYNSTFTDSTVYEVGINPRFVLVE